MGGFPIYFCLGSRPFFCRWQSPGMEGDFFLYFFIINYILLWRPLRWSRNSVSFSCPWGQMTKMSSSYLNQHTVLCVACSIAFSQNHQWWISHLPENVVRTLVPRPFVRRTVHKTDTAELPRRKYKSIRTWRKFENKNPNITNDTWTEWGEKLQNIHSGTPFITQHDYTDCHIQLANTVPQNSQSILD